MKKTKKIIIHSPKGGQGKTTLTANLGMLAAGSGARVLIVDGCSSRGLQRYFNLAATRGLADVITHGAPVLEVAGQVRDNLWILPGGDLAELEEHLAKDKVSPVRQLEDALSRAESQFDVILFDTSPDRTHRLFFCLLYYGDRIIMPIETKSAGLEIAQEFKAYLEELNPRLRARDGKRPISITTVIPYWFGRSRVKQGALEALQESFGDILTEPIGECTGLAEAWIHGESIADRLARTKNPPPNEAHSLKIFQQVASDMLT